MYALAAKLIIQMAAGLGIGKVLDMFVKPKVPAVYYPEPIAPKKTASMIWLLASFVIGVIIARKVGKNMNIKILK
jgi:hypothetical protein